MSNTLPLSWLSVHQAAGALGVPIITLRRAIERNARRSPHGGIEASFDGLVARKLQRRWRVRIDPAWTRAAGT